MQASNVTGVILAAGKATRMQPFSTKYPKPILPVCNRPLIGYQIDEMRRLGIRDILVVVGHLGFEITRTLSDGNHMGVRLRYIDQRETMGIAHAVGQLESHIDGPFLLFLGDVFFQAREMHRMFETMERGANAVLAIRREQDSAAIRKNFAVVLDGEGMVSRVIEKPHHAPSDLKGCGLYLFDPHLFDAIRRTPRTAGRDEYEITESIQILVNDGLRVQVAEVVDFDINVTSPCDLLACNLVQLRRLGRQNLVGQNCRLAEGTEIVNSVIGDNVVMEEPLQIGNSLIFAETHIKNIGPIENMILTSDDVIDCRFAKDVPWPLRIS